jgi:hypothetical protein
MRGIPLQQRPKNVVLHGNGNRDRVKSGWLKVTGESPLEAHCNSHRPLRFDPFRHVNTMPHSIVAVVPAFAHLLHVGALFLVVPLFVAKKRRGLLNGL